ncbi:MAG TPA: NAD(P)H-dependent oxidoreductase [Hydrogenophaga sp.]
MARILVLDGHPASASLCRSLAQGYADAAREAGHEVRFTHLHDLDFDMDFGLAGYVTTKPLEPVLERFLEDLAWCSHFTLVLPMWWGGLPAKLKGLFDRSFLPGRAFDTRNPGRWGMPRPLLTGRTARVVITSDTPSIFLRLAYRNALIWQLRGQILHFVGLRPARFTLFAQASHAKPAQVQGWLARVKALGAKAV